MLKEKQIKDIEEFMSSDVSSEITIDHVDILKKEYMEEESIYHDVVLKENSLGLNVIINNVTIPSECLTRLVTHIVEGINTDQQLSDDEKLNLFINNHDIWWSNKEVNEHTIKVNGEKLRFIIKDIEVEEVVGCWKNVEFTYRDFSLNVKFDVAETLSVILASNIIYMITKFN